MKRTYSYADLSQATDFSSSSMPYAKRTKSSARYPRKKSYKFSSRSAKVASRGSANSCIVPLTVDYDYDLTADLSRGFGWSATNLWINGVPVTPIPGATDLAAVFDCVRVQKVEVSVLPGNDNADYATNTLATGQRNIPYFYDAFDPNDGTNPSVANIRELSTCRTTILNKVVKRTIYPNLNEGTGAVQDLGKTQKNMFTRSDADIPWYGWKCYGDLFNTALTYDVGRISFKVFFECRQSK